MPFAEARRRGYTDGSAARNLALQAALLRGWRPGTNVYWLTPPPPPAAPLPLVGQPVTPVTPAPGEYQYPYQLPEIQALIGAAPWIIFGVVALKLIGRRRG